jgi:Cof subfamily protein (haloacid dehalogenase superfamily)
LGKLQAIVADLDGTLLNSRKQITERSMNALLACQAAGVELVVATARPPRSVRLLCPEVLPLAQMIYYNGALTVLRDSQAEDGIHMEGRLIEQVYKYMQKNHPDVTVTIETGDQMYVNRPLLDYEKEALGFPPGAELPEVTDIARFFESGAAKLLLTGFEPFAPFADRFRGSLNVVRTDNGTLVQLMSAGTTKAAALERLLAPMGITLTDTVCFGDDYNDVPLFELCGYPVAMGNAIDALKQLAWRVTGTNDEDGVAVMLEQLLAEQQ